MTKDEIIRMAREADLWGEIYAMQRFANLVAAAEREACVKDVSNALYGQAGCGKAIESIRARGNNDV